MAVGPAGDAEPPGLCVRFICSADPSRAFIAEALMRHLCAEDDAARAEGDPARVHPSARRVMDEIGIPLRRTEAARPPRRPVAELVISITNRGMPRLTDAVGWSFDDPSAAGEECEALAAFRRVRDEIKRRVDLLLLVNTRRRRAPAPARS